MRALVVRGTDEFAVEDVPRPEPGPFEVLCRVRAVAICGTDPHIIHGEFMGFWPKRWPLIPGPEWCGGVGVVGMLGAGCALARGAGRVLGAGRGARLQRAAELGFEPIDVTQVDLVEEARARTGGRGPEVALECSGDPRAVGQCAALLRKGG